MADWRQIQARIRKAKNSPEALTKLAELFARTRDAMVAWELGMMEEKAGRNDEAGKWYGLAVDRFRRADWKKKAEEALARLGLPVPVASVAPPQTVLAAAESQEPEISETADAEVQQSPVEEPHAEAQPAPGSAESTAVAGEGQRRKRRRGRRGGRGRRRRGSGTPALPAQAFAEGSAALVEQQPPPRKEEPPAHTTPSRAETARTAPPEPPALLLPSERTAHGRAGDPALASRLAQLESKLRRLLSSPLHRLDEVDEAPAGPGVFLLSDSDQIHSYYVEACQTLRVGLGNLVRGGRGASKGGRGARGGFDTSGLRAKLAEHLEISEAKVSQYLKDHCVVRWIQLDDEAPHLAHFAISVLRTPLNLD